MPSITSPLASKHEQLMLECEESLALGKIDIAQFKIKSLNPDGLPPEKHLDLARLCRRSGLIGLGLKILSSSRETASSSSINTEFALLLHQIGCTMEALEILNYVDADIAPEAHVAKARCHLDQYDFIKALPELRAYLEKAPSRYMTLIMRLNLAACLIQIEQFEAAIDHLNFLSEIGVQNDYPLIYAKILVLRAQIQIGQDRLDEARTILHAAERVLKNSSPAESLLIEKWNAVIDGKKSQNPTSLLEFSKKAMTWGDYEMARTADFEILKMHFNEELFNRLYFGTPFMALRNKIEELNGHKLSTRELSIGSRKAPTLDLRTTVERLANKSQKSAPPDVVLKALFSDLYAPLSLGRFFSELFPGERFQIESSPQKINQALTRAKKWLSERHLPIEIEMNELSVAARIKGPVCIYLSTGDNSSSNLTEMLYKLKSIFKEKPFTLQQCQRALDLPAPKCRNFLEKAEEAKLILRAFNANEILYSLAL